MSSLAPCRAGLARFHALRRPSRAAVPESFIPAVWLGGVLFAANVLIHLRRRDVRAANAEAKLETMLLEENNKALIRAHYDAMINWFEPDAVRQQIADDYFDHQTGRHMSAEDMIAYAQAMHAAFSDLSVTLNDVIAEGERVAVRVTWRGTHSGPYCGIAPTGKRFEFTGIVFWRAREGKIVERWAEIEFSALIAQLSSSKAA